MGTFKSYLVVGRGESLYPGGTTRQITNYYGMELVSFKRGPG